MHRLLCALTTKLSESTEVDAKTCIFRSQNRMSNCVMWIKSKSRQRDQYNTWACGVSRFKNLRNDHKTRIIFLWRHFLNERGGWNYCRQWVEGHRWIFNKTIIALAELLEGHMRLYALFWVRFYVHISSLIPESWQGVREGGGWRSCCMLIMHESLHYWANFVWFSFVIETGFVDNKQQLSWSMDCPSWRSGGWGRKRRCS